MFEYNKTDEGFSVKFPYDLKDEFRSAFKTSKWDPKNKVWKVGPRSLKKLKHFEKITEDFLSQIDLQDELDLKDKEVSEILMKLEIKNETLKQNIKSLEDSIEIRTKQLENLKSLNEDIENSEEYRDLVKKNQNIENAYLAEKEKTKNLLNSLIDMDLIIEYKRKMSSNMCANDTRKKAIFRETVLLVDREKEKLEELGYTSEGINFLSYSNVNRPDRDHPKFCTEEMIYNITKLEK